MHMGPSYKILIVDDNYSNRFTLRTLIEEYIDATVIEADSGEKALQELLNHSVDLIILDVYMDNMDGFEVASIIKQRKKTRDIPIVFLTASYISEEFRKRGFQIGAVDYLTKPIDEYQLINRINVYLKLIEKERTMNLLLEQKVSEQTKELRKAKEAAEAANEAKSTFLANMSHELRTPLNILLSTTQLLNLYLQNDTVLDKEKVGKKIDIQVQNCYRLLRLVNNLIDITKMDTGHFELKPTRCNIVQIVEAIALSVVEYVENKGIKLVFDTNAEEKILVCDLDSIERIVLNLLSNAIKFTPSGGSIFVNVRVVPNKVRISIRDTGVGISEDKVDLIFERFKQVDDLLTRKNEGSGIGLSLVKSLVELHGGEIFVHSKKDSGSEFTVELPLQSDLQEENTEEILQEVSNDNIINKVHIEFSDIYF